MERTDSIFKPPKQKITDPEELEDYKLRERTRFEVFFGFHFVIV